MKLRTVCSVPGCPELAEPGRGQCAAHVRPPLGRPHRRERAIALERDGRRCWRCGAPATEVDHILARVFGGPDVASNYRPACRRCNASRGHGAPPPPRDPSWPTPPWAWTQNDARRPQAPRS